MAVGTAVTFNSHDGSQGAAMRILMVPKLTAVSNTLRLFLTVVNNRL